MRTSSFISFPLFALMLLFAPACLANNVGDLCSTLGVTKLSADGTTTIGCFKRVSGQADCGTQAAPSCVYKQMTFWPSNASACEAGTLLQWDMTTNSAKCAPIYGSMTCYSKSLSGHTDADPSSTENVTVKCDAGYYVMAGSCWRSENLGNPENWQGGLFIGDSVSKDTYVCRYEGAAATNATVICCK